MPPLKQGKILQVGGRVIVGGTPGAGPTPSDYQITFTRTTPIRLASNPFKLGITFTHETFPSGGQGTAVAAAKALMVACNWDFINQHNHGYGANGPWLNADKTAGKTYADRATWTGWTAFDAVVTRMRDCGGSNSELMFTLLPPGWMKMDGGSETNAAADPLNAIYTPDPNRTWSNLNYNFGERHTDAHRVDMIDLAKAIALRYADVKYFSFINEQKGNYPGAGYVEEISNDGLLGAGINNYFEMKRYMEGVRAGLDSVGKTAVAVVGPYMPIDGNGADELSVTYAAQGFPQPAAAADLATNKYKTYYATVVPHMTRVKTFAEWIQANVSAAARGGYFATEWKTLAEDNDTGNWAVYYPHRWKFFPMLRRSMDKFRTYAGIASAKIFGMETYIWKITSSQLPGDAEQAAMAAELLRHQLESGMYANMHWAPESGATTGNRGNLYTTTTKTLALGGGVALPMYYAEKAFCDHFRGVDIYAAPSTNADVVTAVASPTKTLLINHTANPITVQINGGPVQGLTGFEVRVVTA